MLKISATEREDRTSMGSSGLIDWALGYLRRSWKSKQRSRKGRTCVLDLDDVISVDAAGEDRLQGLKTGEQA